MLSADIRFAVARTVRSELRGSDVLARYGGDEFIALLPETNARGAREMGEQIDQCHGRRMRLTHGD